MPKALLKGSKAGTKPLEYEAQSNGVIKIHGQAEEGHKWSYTITKKEFESMYQIVDEEKAKE